MRLLGRLREREREIKRERARESEGERERKGGIEKAGIMEAYERGNDGTRERVKNGPSEPYFTRALSPVIANKFTSPPVEACRRGAGFPQQQSFRMLNSTAEQQHSVACSATQQSRPLLPQQRNRTVAS